MKSLRPTLRTLAAEAGVSAMTLSLALRNRPEIPLATRKRLQRLAQERGYRPDPAIAKLMAHLRTKSSQRSTTNICGLILSHRLGDFRHRPFPQRLEAGMRAAADALGFAYDTIEVASARARNQLATVLRHRGIEGIILLPMPTGSDLQSVLDWSPYSVVAATSSVLTPQFHNVTPHHYDNVLHACQRLVAAGRKRIGLAISQAWNERVRFRWSGAIAWQNSFGGTEPVPPFFGASAHAEVDDERFGDWLRSHRPDAILVEAIAPPLLNATIAKMPAAQRPLVVTMNWPSPAGDPGMDQKPDVIGKVAVEILAGMIYRGEKGIPQNPQHIAVTGEWRAPRTRDLP